jgi:uncharacterized membrane protein YfcA
MWLVLLSKADITSPGVVIDPKRDDLALRLSRCNVSDPQCFPDRVCAIDPVYSKDAAVNCTCGTDERGHAQCHMCLHTKFSNVQSADLLGTVAIFFGGVLAGMSGIGGGGLNVPLLMLVMNFDVWEEAVPLSHIMVFGNAIAQNAVNLRRHHPLQPGRPLVDFAVPILLLPAQLGGNSLGVLVGPSFPGTIMTLLASILLTLAGAKTLRTAVRAFRAEQAAAAQRGGRGQGGLAQSLAADGPADSLAVSEAGDASGEADARPLRLLAGHAVESSMGGAGRRGGGGGGAGLVGASVEDSSTPAHTEGRAQVLPKVGALLAFWAIFVLDYYAAHSIPSRGSCSAGKWALRAFLFLAVVAAVAVGGVLTRRSQAAQAAGGAWPLLPGDILWSKAQCVSIPLLAYGVGTVAGLLGLGGGELMAPLLLAIGMLPQVASATSAFMITFTSSADVVHYLFEGVLSPDPGYVAWALVLGFCSALTGRLLAVHATSRMHHPSLIVFALAAILFLSTVLLIVRSAQGKPECAPRRRPAAAPHRCPAAAPHRCPATPPACRRSARAATRLSAPHLASLLLLLHAGSFGDLCADSDAICPVNPSQDFY